MKKEFFFSMRRLPRSIASWKNTLSNRGKRSTSSHPDACRRCPRSKMDGPVVLVGMLADGDVAEKAAVVIRRGKSGRARAKKTATSTAQATYGAQEAFGIVLPLLAPAAPASSASPLGYPEAMDRSHPKEILCLLSSPVWA